MMTESISLKVVNSIADELQVEPTSLDYALQDHVDTDALALLERHGADDWTLTFEIPDGTVTVTGNGGIHVDTDAEPGPGADPVPRTS